MTTFTQNETFSALRSSRSMCGCYKMLVLLRGVALLLILAMNCITICAARPVVDDTHMYASTESLGIESKSAGISSFVTTSGHQFVLNGEPLYVNGANLYWLMNVAADTSQRSTVSDMLQQAAGVGVTVVRTWAFADGNSYNSLQTSPGVYNEATFQGLDFAVSEAKKNGIRVILSFVNNYNDYGGKAQYVSWANTYAGASLNSEDDFYSNPTTCGWYKNHIKTVLNRVNTFTGVAYRNEPAIFSWELMNEPRCPSDTTGNTLQTWISEMAAYVKSLDTSHLLEIGLEGFYSASDSDSSQSANPSSYCATLGTDFIRNNQATGIDFATVHSYPDSWLSSSSYDQKSTWMSTWVQTHIDDSASILSKPVLFGEFGISSWTSGYTESERVTSMSDMYNAVYESAKSGDAGAGALVWQLVTSSLQSSLADGYEIVLSSSPSICNLMTQQASRLSSL